MGAESGYGGLVYSEGDVSMGAGSWMIGDAVVTNIANESCIDSN